MKTPTNRVHQNAFNAVHEEIRSKREEATSEALPSKMTTVVFSSPDGEKEWCRVDFPEKVFASIKSAAKKLGVGLDEFFEMAIKSKFSRAGITLKSDMNGNGKIRQMA